MVRACGSYPQRPGFESLHRHQLELTLEWGGKGEMRKTITWATVGLFALSVQGVALGQTPEKAAESALPPALESPAPLTPSAEVVAPGQVEKKVQKKSSLKKKGKQKKAKKKRVRKAKKKTV